jgi:hypothetical protein
MQAKKLIYKYKIRGMIFVAARNGNRVAFIPNSFNLCKMQHNFNLCKMQRQNICPL